MKIVLEAPDLLEIVRNHITSTNLLGLSEGNFIVDLEMTDDDEVEAVINTISVGDVTEVPKPKKKRKRRTKAEIEAERAAEEANQQDDATEAEAASDSPPWQATEAPEPETETEPVSASKSLFG